MIRAAAILALLLASCGTTPADPTPRPRAILRLATGLCDCHEARHGTVTLVEGGEVTHLEVWEHGQLVRRIPARREKY